MVICNEYLTVKRIYTTKYKALKIPGKFSGKALEKVDRNERECQASRTNMLIYSQLANLLSSIGE